MKSRILFIAIVLTLMLSNEGVSQWKRVFNNPGKGIHTVYFLDGPTPALVGFVAYSGGVSRTSDGGLTWTEVISQNISITGDIVFKDEFEGWVGERDGDLYHTFDGGLSWSRSSTKQTKLSSIDGLYYNKYSQLLLAASWFNGINVSSDAGATWVPIANFDMYFSGFAFADDKNGIATGEGHNDVHAITSDGGRTWTPTLISTECWQPLAIRNSNTFLMSAEGPGSGIYNRTSGFFRTDDFGRSWKFILTDLRGKVTGDLRGDLCRLYIQTQSGGVRYNGMCRSLDMGQTWETIGGPSNSFDKRFFVSGTQVFAGDESGGLWYLNDTIGSPFWSILQLNRDTVNFDTVGECTESEIAVLMKNNLACDTIHIKSLTWKPNQSTFTASLPLGSQSIAPGENDTIKIDFNTNGTGSFTRQLVVTIEQNGSLRDTIITVLGTRIKSDRASFSPSALDFDTVSLCDTVEKIAYLRNNSCDSATIDYNDFPGSGFTLLNTTSRVTIGSGDSLAFRVRFIPSSKGIYTSFLSVRVKPISSTEHIVVLPLAAYVDEIFTHPSIDPLQLSFSPKSFCDSLPSIKDVLVKNNMKCSDLSIDSIWLDSSLVFGVNLPSYKVLRSDSTLSIPVSFISEYKGSHIGIVHVRYSLGNTKYDTTITILGLVTEGTRILASSPNTLDFGPTTLCQERDSIVTLHNTGCDTLKITYIDLLGNGFTSDTTTPIIIPPGSSVTLPVGTKVDTSQGNVSTGTITITSDADNQIAPITLSRGYTYPKSYSFHIAMVDATATSGEIVRLAIVGEQGLGSAGSAVNRLDLDLSLNEDLLEYIRPEGSNTVSKNGSRITISNQNELTSVNDTLAIMVYHVFLTKDSATDILVSNISINNGDTSSCAPRIAALTQAGFAYRYECGDKHIQSFLRTGKASLEITSIHPNPTSRDATVSFESPTSDNAQLQLLDELGKVVLEETLSTIRGTNDHTIAIPKHWSGTFYLRLQIDNDVVTGKFVKQ